MVGTNRKRGIPFSGRVLITGDTGFIAKNLIGEIENRWKFADIVTINGSKFFDLTRLNHVTTMFNSIEANHGPIRTVIHLAGKSGGIKDNMERQATYFWQNLMMGMNMLETCAAPNRVVEKLIMLMGGCSYALKPDKITPYKEGEMWDGLPVETSLGYSFAKKTLLIAADVYKKQFGIKTTILLPTNLIGKWDNCLEQESHVAMALIQRFIEACDEGYDSVTVWGNPNVTRDFIYAGDFGKLFIDIINNFEEIGPLNISTGIGTTIEELAVAIKDVTGFSGKIHFDTNKPTGQMHKVLDNTKLLGVLKKAGVEWEPTPVREAVGKTVEWYRERVHKK
jgi:GDP-L-fucose synthase